MSQKLIAHNKDLKRLMDEGYEIEVKGGYLIAHHIPYVNKSKDIKYGKLIVALNINNDAVTYQKHCSKHVINFMGEYPVTKTVLKYPQLGFHLRTRHCLMIL